MMGMGTSNEIDTLVSKELQALCGDEFISRSPRPRRPLAQLPQAPAGRASSASDAAERNVHPCDFSFSQAAGEFLLQVPCDQDLPTEEPKPHLKQKQSRPTKN